MSFALTRKRIKLGGSPQRWVGAGMLLAIVAMCVFVPILDSDGVDTLVASPLEKPSLAHPFGTDEVGRDVFVRTFAGGRLDLGIGLLVVGGAFLVGLVVGVLTAITPLTWVDRTTIRLIDGIVAFPFLILVLACIAVVGADRSFWVLPRGVPALLISMIIVDWTIYARLARSATGTLRERDFVIAARLQGYSTSRIVFRHLAPGVSRSVAAYAVADVIIIVIVTASLSFVGAGVQPPTPEWGAIMFEGRGVLATAWWITTAPGVLLVLTGLGLSLVAD